MVELYYLINPKKNYQTNTKELIYTAVNVPSQIHPDIYYLVFDSYPSSSFLKEALQISNTFLDTSLTNRKFFIPQNSSSFYNYTAFSIASTFSMDKLHWLGSISSPKPEHFSEAVNQIKNAPLLAFLKKSGYSFSNLSFFDLQDNKAITAKKLFYLAPPDLIFRNSLFTRFKWQLIPKIFPSYINVLIKDQSKNIINTLNDFKGYNKIVLKTLQQYFLLNNKYPKFTYAHFGMPHFPFIYDSTGSEFPITEPYDYSFEKNKAKYQSYLVYVNKIIINLVDEILNKNETPPVIIIQSDHGCQEYNFVKETSDVFRNYTAYYFPDNNYSMLNKEMNNINTFRIVLNKYFDQKLKMLKDTSIYLKF